MWALTTSTGFGCYFEPYCGGSTRIPDAGLGQGPNVVLGLVEKMELQPGADLFFDNLFTSFPLLEKLSEKKIAGTGTVRQLRLGNTNLPRKKEADKWERGSTKTVFQDDKICVLWKDNKPVYLASNKYQGEISGQAKRWSKVEKKHVMVDRPELVTVYNTYMGGVDVLDGMVSAYRIPIRKKKWWWPFYSWSLSVSAVNAWRLMCHVTGEKQPYIHFLRELVSQIYALHGSPPNPRGRSITVSFFHY